MNTFIRGQRNNNPFNIKKSQIAWIGEKKDCSDPVFEQFETFDYGVRAGIKLLSNYLRRGYDTPKKIINRYAPSSENNVKAYLDFLHSEGYTKSDDAVISMATLDFFNLCNGIMRYESQCTIPHQTFSRILKML